MLMFLVRVIFVIVISILLLDILWIDCIMFDLISFCIKLLVLCFVDKLIGGGGLFLWFRILCVNSEVFKWFVVEFKRRIILFLDLKLMDVCLV